MKLALLKGNRFNPWHLQAFNRLGPEVSVTAFRAESEIQEHFRGRDDGSLNFDFESIFFDTQAGPGWQRMRQLLRQRYLGREPRIAPFADRLEGFDAIQTWELFTDWTAEALRARDRWGMPVSVMVWDNLPFNMETPGYRRRIKEEAIRHADRFVVHTERSRRTLLMEGAEAEKIVQINPGVDTAQFSPGEGDRNAWAVPDDAFVILFVGWFLPRKGLDFLVLALRELLSDSTLSGRDIRLVMVGSGPGQDRIEALIERCGVGAHCELAGSLPYSGMPNVFRAADAFVLPSIATEGWQEQFGMSILEAMACGTPVVSTYSGAIPEIVGEAGALCQPNDFLSLAETLKTLIEDEDGRAELGRLGRARAEERFSLDAYARGLSELYASMTA